MLDKWLKNHLTLTQVGLSVDAERRCLAPQERVEPSAQAQSSDRPAFAKRIICFGKKIDLKDLDTAFIR
jgi:hypothetical protein